MTNISPKQSSDRFLSQCVPFLSFRDMFIQKRIEEYIFEKAKIFFKHVAEENIDIHKRYLDYSKTIAPDFDFIYRNNPDTSQYLYKYLLSDIKKSQHRDRKIDFCPKWSMTFDKDCAPIQISYISPHYSKKKFGEPKFSKFRYPSESDNTFLRYGTININKKVIFYYLYFEIQELLDIAKSVQYNNANKFQT